jgi:hypothetical protein
LSARFSNLNVVFFTCFYRFWTEAATAKAAAASSYVLPYDISRYSYALWQYKPGDN